MSYRSSDSSGSSVASENVYCVFMHIVEGVGLQRSNGRICGAKRNHEQIMLLVSLNNVKFEIEGHATETVTIFNSNCIWECGLEDIRRMKTDHRPVRIECFQKNGISSSSPLQLIGTLLLPIRGLPTLATLKNYQAKFLWHKLGSLCADWRPFKPELYLLLIIAKKSIIEDDKFELLLGKKQTITSLSPHVTETSSMLQSQSNVYVQLLEQVGLIQVGNNPEVDCDIFQATLTLKRVKDLATLLEVDSCQPEKNTFVFSYELLGNSSYVEIALEHSDSYTLNDKLALKFKSSLKSLRLYFQRIFYIPFNIYFNGHAIANYRFDCSKFLPDDCHFDSNHFWDKNGSFYFDHLHKILSPRAKKPSVEFSFKLQLLEVHHRRSCKDIAIFGGTPFSSNDDATGAGGDNMNSRQISTARQETASQHSAASPNNYSRTNSAPSLKYLKENSSTSSSAAAQATRDVACDTKDLTPNVCFHASTDSFDLVSKITAAVDTKELEANDIEAKDIEALSMKAVEELEAWKTQQMDEFLEKLDRKERVYLKQLECDWRKREVVLQEHLNARANECVQLKAQVEAANLAMKALKDNDHTQKIHQLEMDVKRLETELRHQQRRTAAKQQDIQDKHHDEKTKLQTENVVLKKNVSQLEQKMITLGKTHFPAEELKEMIVDLREQTARFAEVERLKNFFEEKYNQALRDLKRLKLSALKQKEKKLQTRLKRDGYSSQDISNDESEEKLPRTSRSKPKKTIREMLLKQSDTSDACDLDTEVP